MSWFPISLALLLAITLFPCYYLVIIFLWSAPICYLVPSRRYLYNARGRLPWLILSPLLDRLSPSSTPLAARIFGVELRGSKMRIFCLTRAMGAISKGSHAVKAVVEGLRPMLDGLLFLLYGRVPPDTRFDRREPLPEGKPTSDGGQEVLVNGLPFHMYDLRSELDDVRQRRDKSRLRRWFWGDGL